MSGTPQVSSLHQLNLAASAAIASYIHSKVGIDLEVAALSSVDDIDTDMIAVQRRSTENGKPIFPAVVTSRSTLTREMAQRVDDHRFQAQIDGHEKSFDYRVVTVGYSTRLYVDSIQEAELVVERLVLLSEPKFTFSYAMPGLLESEPLMGVATLGVSSIRTTYNTRSAQKEDGEVFKIAFETNVRALIVSQPRAASIIKTIFFTVYDLNQVERFSGPDFENINPHESGAPISGQIVIE